DEGSHLFELLRSRLNVVVAEHHAADLRCADVAGEIDTDTLFLETSEVLAERAPIGIDLVMVVGVALGLDNRVVERSDGTAFASDLGRDSLINFGRQARIEKDGEFRLTEHVDETGGDDFARSINSALALGGREMTDGGNFAVANADVAGVPRRTGAID